MAFLSTPWRNPVDGYGTHAFVGETPERAEYIAGLFKQLAVTHWLTVREIDEMTELALRAIKPELYDRLEEFNQLVAEAKRDRDLLKLPLPVDEALAIWVRERDRLRHVASLITDPAKRQRIVAFLEEQEAAMDALIARAQVRVLAAQAKGPLRRKRRARLDG